MKMPNMFYEARNGRGKIWILELLIFLLVFIIILSVQSVPSSIAQGVWIATNPEVMDSIAEAAMSGSIDAAMAAATDMVRNMPDWFSIVGLFCTGIATLGAILFCRWFQKRNAATLGFRRGRAVREYVIGALAAVVMISAAVGVGALTGAYSISVGSISVGTIVLYFIGYLIQGMSEETLCRGYLMVSIARKNPVWLSVLLSALVFAALHLSNNGLTALAFLNLFLFGVLMSVYVIKRGNLWGVCALHSFWNFFQGHVFGIRVSGIENNASFLSTTPVGSDLLSGGDFGAEGSLTVTLILIAAICLIVFVVPKKEDEFTAETEALPAEA